MYYLNDMEPNELKLSRISNTNLPKCWSIPYKQKYIWENGHALITKSQQSCLLNL